MNAAAAVNFTIIITAVAYGILAAVAFYAPFIGPLLRFLLVLSLWRYGYEVLRYCAQGRHDLPPPDANSVNPFGAWPLLLHFLAFPAAIVAALIYLPFGYLFAVAIVAVFPASAALMAVTNRLESAFSPTGLVGCVRILGADYFWLVLVVLIVAIAAFGIGELIAGGANPLSIALATVVECWGMLAVFALTGSAVHRHRLDFDIPGELPDREETARADRLREWQRVLDEAYASLRGGNPEAGYRMLRQFLAAEARNPDAGYWLVENLFDWQEKRHALGVAARLVSSELAEGRPSQAFDLYQRARRSDRDFAVAPADIEALATFAESVGHAGIASELKVQAAGIYLRAESGTNNKDGQA